MTPSKLSRHVSSRPGEISRLARASGVSDAQMSRIVSGQRGASLAVALAIADATNGLITPSDVFAARIVAQGAKSRKSTKERA